jgi:hypothetical protein
LRSYAHSTVARVSMETSSKRAGHAGSRAFGFVIETAPKGR